MNASPKWLPPRITFSFLDPVKDPTTFGRSYGSNCHPSRKRLLHRVDPRDVFDNQHTGTEAVMLSFETVRALIGKPKIASSYPPAETRTLL